MRKVDGCVNILSVHCHDRRMYFYGPILHIVIERRVRQSPFQPRHLSSIGILLSNTHSGTVDFYLERLEWVLS